MNIFAEKKKLLSGFEIEKLREFALNNKTITEDEYIKTNIDYLNFNIISLDVAKFEPHPYIPILVNFYGEVKYNDTILKTEINDGYVYVNVPFEIQKIIDETKTRKIQKNKMITPIVGAVVAHSNDKYEVKKKINTKKHPCIDIYVYKDSCIVDMNYSFFIGIDSFSRPNPNVGKAYKKSENLGDKFVEIPIHIHRLVAETWLKNDNYNDYKTVHHISGNKDDNRVSNLMWVTKNQHEEIHKKKKG